MNPAFNNFSISALIAVVFRGWTGRKFLANRSRIWVGFDLMYDNGWINTWHFFVTPGENISEFLEEGSVSCYLFRGAIDDRYVCFRLFQVSPKCQWDESL